MSDALAPTDEYDENDRKHLDQIQAIVSRLAGNQFLVKGWALTVAAAVLGYAATHEGQWFVALLGIAVTLAFAGVDAYFLRQERLFRLLWVDAVARPRRVPLYSLNISPYLDRVHYFREMPDENGRRRPGVAMSAPVRGLYGAVLIVAVVIIGTSLLLGSTLQTHRPPARYAPATHQPR